MRNALLGVLGGVVGVGLGLLIWHLYADHLLVHELVTRWNQAVAAAPAGP